ncbi:MAG TPA: dihydrolipoamide acetyltransferase family protein [Solirubrobacteraceae bacterium]|jgi:pyruvate dehydrogenase E2 component (dihydrolipoamide acetyltransferase)|nr:dihydrolipoamide acetyltransferase family protein [Solirubrobacteraceae bacterium]
MSSQADVTMPRLSDSMEEGTILKWLRAPGDHVRRGDPLVEIETDKANMTYEADRDGVLEILAQEGETLPIGGLIARLGSGEGDEGAASAAQGDEPSRAAEMPSEPVEAAGRVRASPVARRLARESGVDLHGLRGSGPGGRIVRVDVEAAIAAGGTAPPGDPGPAQPSTGATAGATPPPAPANGVGTAKGAVVIEEPTRTQQAIARRMAESRATVPDFTVTVEVDMVGAVELRDELARLGADGPRPSYNDMIVKACGLALREFPRVNGSYRDGRFELHSRVNVGIAVAAPDALVVPTVFDADTKSLGEIARESQALAGRVRDATITPPELAGATFTVSNLGMFGVSQFTAVINPPQAAILAVGSLVDRVVAHQGGIAARATLSLSLTCDHRILYGADAARFLTRVRELLERPVALAL